LVFLDFFLGMATGLFWVWDVERGGRLGAFRWEFGMATEDGWSEYGSLAVSSCAYGEPVGSLPAPNWIGETSLSRE
jgi:hypothetical protein